MGSGIQIRQLARLGKPRLVIIITHLPDRGRLSWLWLKCFCIIARIVLIHPYKNCWMKHIPVTITARQNLIRFPNRSAPWPLTKRKDSQKYHFHFFHFACNLFCSYVPELDANKHVFSIICICCIIKPWLTWNIRKEMNACYSYYWHLYYVYR